MLGFGLIIAPIKPKGLNNLSVMETVKDRTNALIEINGSNISQISNNIYYPDGFIGLIKARGEFNSEVLRGK